MHGRLTVGFDGSPLSTRAVRWTAEEAERRSAIVHVVACYCIPTIVGPWISTVPYSLATARAATERSVDDVVARVQVQFPDVKFEPCSVLGRPRDQLVVEADTSDLLVVGTRGEASSTLMGSVAFAVARTAPCPVVLVPDSEPRRPHGRIVVGVDSSPAAQRALDWATDEADLRGAELVVVHAWDYPYGDELRPLDGRHRARDDGALLLEAAAERSRDRGLGPVRDELIEGSPASTLTTLAANADLLVVGSRGRGILRSALLGSVAHAVTEHAPCPVVVIRDFGQ